MERSLENDFAKPGPWFRGQPFWAWNGALEPQELRRQIRLMKRMGLGGFFMHSRIGLSTPYLRDEWFRCIEACIDEAQKQDMLAWLYDDDRWPSGAAGRAGNPKSPVAQAVPADGGAQGARAARWTADVVAAFRATVKGTTATGVQPIPRGRRPPSLAHGEASWPSASWWTRPRVVQRRHLPGHPEPAAVRRFIAVTHEAYRRRVGSHFGKTVPGIFTDEPNHGQKFDRDNKTGRLWTPLDGRAPRRFQQTLRLRPDPAPGGAVPRRRRQQITPARHDFHDCVTALFVDSFSRQIGEWCGEHGSCTPATC